MRRIAHRAVPLLRFRIPSNAKATLNNAIVKYMSCSWVWAIRDDANSGDPNGDFLAEKEPHWEFLVLIPKSLGDDDFSSIRASTRPRPIPFDPKFTLLSLLGDFVSFQNGFMKDPKGLVSIVARQRSSLKDGSGWENREGGCQTAAAAASILSRLQLPEKLRRRNWTCCRRKENRTEARLDPTAAEKKIDGRSVTVLCSQKLSRRCCRRKSTVTVASQILKKKLLSCCDHFRQSRSGAKLQRRRRRKARKIEVEVSLTYEDFGVPHLLAHHVLLIAKRVFLVLFVAELKAHIALSGRALAPRAHRFLLHLVAELGILMIIAAELGSALLIPIELRLLVLMVAELGHFVIMAAKLELLIPMVAGLKLFMFMVAELGVLVFIKAEVGLFILMVGELELGPLALYLASRRTSSGVVAHV
nr:hypothetical protein Iba_chr14bCG12730 [Ipomoea batatas]